MPPTYRFGPYVLDVHERRLTCGGAPCEVQGKVLDLLAALLERPGQLWAREALQARLWPGVFVSEDALFQVIRKARRALDDAPDAPRWIETVAGRGYRFVGELTPPKVVPPPSTGGRPPARPLPPATSFTGREGLLEPLVVELFAHGGLWTLTGPGGVGKTRLALELIERVLTTFTSVPVFCALDTNMERADIRAAIGRATGLAAHALDHTDEIIEELRARGEVVVVLDNAEHVVEALAGEIAGWPAALPAARVVVTSRVRLGLGAERLVDVPPLALHPLDADLAGLAGFGASRLLLERARTAAGYRPTEADAGPLAALAERLGGLPLALELVAPRLRLLSPAQLHGRLGHLLDVGVGRAADRPSRHLTLRSAIATSWELLDDIDRRALSDLSVFAGPFSLEAAEAVVGLGGPDPLEVLERLVDHSLVRRGDGAAPLQLLPSIREFAAEHGAPTAAAPPGQRRWVDVDRGRERANGETRALEVRHQAPPAVGGRGGAGRRRHRAAPPPWSSPGGDPRGRCPRRVDTRMEAITSPQEQRFQCWYLYGPVIS